MLRKSIICIFLVMIWPPAVVAAEDLGASMFSVGGFGTLGVVHSDENKADFTASPAEAVGAGHTQSWSPAVDSLIGVQVTAAINTNLSADLQVISQQNYNDTYWPHVEWANIKYQFNPDFSMRFGRTELPLFLVADSRSVGYANPWVRPPEEMYSLIPVTTNNGIDASYRLPIGAASNTLQATIGLADYNFPIPNGGGVETAKGRDQMVVVDSFEQGFATVEFTYGQTHVTIPDIETLFNAFREFGPDGAGIADRFDVNDRLITFFGMSARYDPSSWFAMAEWGRIHNHSVLVDKTGWYVSSGYRFGKITPYTTYADLRANGSTSNPGLNLSQLPPAYAAAASGLNAALNGILGSASAQRTISAGARWDFYRNVDLKVQYDRTRLAAGSQGTLTNLQPGFQPGSSLNPISITIDFVF
jgi:hypothetical protein